MNTDLLRQIQDVVRETLATRDTPWLNRDGAAAYLGCSASVIDQAAANGVLKRFYIGVSPRFRKIDLDKAMEKGGLKNFRQVKQSRVNPPA